MRFPEVPRAPARCNHRRHHPWVEGSDVGRLVVDILQRNIRTRQRCNGGLDGLGVLAKKVFLVEVASEFRIVLMNLNLLQPY